MTIHEEDNDEFLATQFNLGGNTDRPPSMEEIMLGISGGDNVDQMQPNVGQRSNDEPTSSQVLIFLINIIYIILS